MLVIGAGTIGHTQRNQQTSAHQADAYTLQLQHFAAVIRGEETPLCSALNGLRTLEATQAVLVAAQTGAPVFCADALPPTHRTQTTR